MNAGDWLPCIIRTYLQNPSPVVADCPPCSLRLSSWSEACESTGFWQMSRAGYCNLQVHSQLISPSALLLIQGGYELDAN